MSDSANDPREIWLLQQNFQDSKLSEQQSHLTGKTEGKRQCITHNPQPHKTLHVVHSWM